VPLLIFIAAQLMRAADAVGTPAHSDDAVPIADGEGVASA
jgi:hypothetical protein